MQLFLLGLIAIILNLIVAYIISLFNFTLGVAWFCFAIGFRFGVWHGGNEKEKEYLSKEEFN